MNSEPATPWFRSDAERWRAVCARDERADGHFVYGVRTTGVYARPSSAARRPRRENVVFFDSSAAAEAAGYRQSQRRAADRSCAAAERASLVAAMCRHLEGAEQALTLEQLAEHAGMSRFHLHKLFKAETGLTPKAYAAAARANKLRAQLGRSERSITEAIYDAGFGSSSRFYEHADRLLGMRARDYRAGGVGVAMHFAVGQCSLGAVLVAQSERGVCAILLGDEPEPLLRELQELFPRAELLGGDDAFEQRVAQIIGFLEQPARGLNLPLDVRGTAFQERVWRALCEIPVGTTLSYTELAERIGAPSAVRAVAHACARNRLAVAIPCHRVVRRDGDLAGYRWGIERKRELLARERTAAKPA